jgi:hypothetical protein
MPVTVTHWTPVLHSLLEETRGVLSRTFFLPEYTREGKNERFLSLATLLIGMPEVQRQIPC